MLYSEQRIRALAFLEEQDRGVQDPVDLGVHQIVSFSLGAIPLSVFSVIFHESRTGWFPHGMRAFFHPAVLTEAAGAHGKPVDINDPPRVASAALPAQLRRRAGHQSSFAKKEGFSDATFPSEPTEGESGMSVQSEVLSAKLEAHQEADVIIEPKNKQGIIKPTAKTPLILQVNRQARSLLQSPFSITSPLVMAALIRFHYDPLTGFDRLFDERSMLLPGLPHWSGSNVNVPPP
ncbi:hypothetical protein V8E55_012102 [Tylopilus felleus]